MPILYHMGHSSLPSCSCLLLNSDRERNIAFTRQLSWLFQLVQQINCFILKLPWVVAVLLLLSAKKMSRLSFGPTAIPNIFCIIFLLCLEKSMEKVYSVYFQKSIVLIFERILVISAFSNVFKFLHFEYVQDTQVAHLIISLTFLHTTDFNSKKCF